MTSSLQKNIVIICVTIFLVACSSAKTSTQLQSSLAAVLSKANELFVTVQCPATLAGKSGALVVEFFSDNQLTGTPAQHATALLDLSAETTASEPSVSASGLSAGTYFVRAYFDANQDGQLNAGELVGTWQQDNRPASVEITVSSRLAVHIALQ